MADKSVCIIHAGGTIGMRSSRHGYVPAPGFLAEEMRQMPELRSRLMPKCEIHEYDPLLDSSNVCPADWVRLARDIDDNYDRFDAFVILHGTDTMAYTASALSFMLQWLGKTVIFTGSQIPLCELRNDARDNLVSSLLIAAREPLPEVCLFFDQKLLRGNRARKVNADRFDAFASPNFPPLGIAGVDITIRRDLVLPVPTRELEVAEISEPFVGQMRLFPGISADIVHNFLRPPLQGLIIEAYGVGNAPARNTALLEALREATKRGVVIVCCTQCLRGTVDLGDYATGAALRRVGVISGSDMTPEAALAKLYYLLSLELPPPEVRRLMQESLRGELSPSPTSAKPCAI